MSNNYDDEDEALTTEVLWSFRNIKQELLDPYPNGRCITENLNTIGGENTWKIEFYPNGKDSTTLNKITVVITLTKSNDKSLLLQTEAECNFRFQNLDKRINYVGKIDRQNFKSFVSAQDSSFDSSLLSSNEFSNTEDKNFLIGISVSQFKSKVTSNEEITFSRNLKSATCLEDDFEIQKVNVNPLFDKA
jgi:hypothetical protein